MKLCALCQINETGRRINKIPVCSPCFRAGEYNLPENRDRLLDDVKAASAKRKAQKAKAKAKKEAKKPAPKKPAPKKPAAKAEVKEPEQPEEPESKDEAPDTGKGEGVPEEPATGS